MYVVQFRRKDLLALANVRVSCQCVPVLDCVSYSYARRTSWLSLGLGRVVNIFQFWIVYPTVSYTSMSFWLSLGLGLVVSIVQFWIVYHTVTQEGLPGCIYGYG